MLFVVEVALKTKNKHKNETTTTNERTNKKQKTKWQQTTISSFVHVHKIWRYTDIDF